MPAHATLREYGYEISLRPVQFWQRHLRWPFYFQHTNPRFSLKVKRLPGAPSRRLFVRATPPNGEPFETQAIDVGGMVEGETKEFKLNPLLIQNAGHVTWDLVLDRVRVDSEHYREPRRPLYSFEMRSTESLWLGIGSVAVVLGAALLNTQCQKASIVQPAKVEQVIHVPTAPAPIVQPNIQIVLPTPMAP